MSKYTVEMVKTVEVEIEDKDVEEGVREIAAMIVAKYFLDHEEEEEEERKEDLPMSVRTQYVGKVVSYDWDVVAKKL